MILLWKIFILLGNKQYFLQKIAFTRRSFGFLLIIYFWACCKSVIIQMSLMKGALFQKKKKIFLYILRVTEFEILLDTENFRLLQVWEWNSLPRL